MYLGTEKIDPLHLEPSEKTAEEILGIRFEMDCVEEADSFIFRSIEPFCRRITKVLILNKKKLEDVITKQMVIKPLQDVHCVSCGWSKGKRNAKYCENCGQRLRE